ncbi:MAG TPA: sterol desaturase family protein [Chthoniobacterales bacterium]|jgi:4-hydroxysphinganine ceramide fatty acyl 2-hydroxylase|nr:sterol desaturase family protein [Chthoniobacterales bacterium]
MNKLFVSNKNETVRMFESNFMEFFSHVHPATPVILYGPIIALMLYLAFVQKGLSFLTVLGFFVIGVLTWTLLEYLIHRYVFHYQPKTRVGKLVHFIMHGVHHDYPNDATRLVMPPIISVPLAVVFYVVFILTLGRFAPAALAGFGFGYVCYDTIHYATHHFAMNGGVWRWLKQYHLRHHYQDDHAGYGVSSPLWDYVFGTSRK